MMSKARRGHADHGDRQTLQEYTFVPMAERALDVEDVRRRCKKGGRWVLSLKPGERAYAERQGWLQ